MRKEKSAPAKLYSESYACIPPNNLCPYVCNAVYVSSFLPFPALFFHISSTFRHNKFVKGLCAAWRADVSVAESGCGKLRNLSRFFVLICWASIGFFHSISAVVTTFSLLLYTFTFAFRLFLPIFYTLALGCTVCVFNLLVFITFN